MLTARNRTIAVALASLFLFHAPAIAQMDHSKMHGMSPASTAYMDAMAMTGKAGADFALMMIPHHQSAIDMAKAYLASGENDPELTTLSNEIIAAQEKEIAFLKGWLSKNGQ
jgi:uncharacterized protein (DUF305 family)